MKKARHRCQHRDLERTRKLVDRYESRPLVAHFTPRKLSVNTGRGLSLVPSNAQFRARAKALYQAVAADLKARCVQAFAIKDPVDVKIQQGLKDDLACVVRTELEGVEAFARSLLAIGRKLGLKLAVRFFEHYLGASGSAIEMRRDEALEFDLIKNAVQFKGTSSDSSSGISSRQSKARRDHRWSKTSRKIPGRV